MKRLRILMDGNTISETPDGWEDIVSSIKRVKELNSIFITTDADLTFRDDGYTYLKTKYDAGFCNSVEVELQELCNGVYEKFFSGIIFISSAQVDRKQCTIKIKTEDNSFYAKINNNKSLEIFPFAEQTKNSAIDTTNPQYTLAACAYEKVQLFNPADGVYAGVLVNPPYTGAMYPVYNLFQYLISFMSDNTIEFDSTLFGAGGDYEGLVVTVGIVLRQYLQGGTTETDFKERFQKISFQQLFTEVNKKINIGMFVDYSGVLPKIRIERRSYLQNSGTSFSALNIDELKESIDTDQLFGSVRLGSTTVSDKAATPTQQVSFPEDITFLGFKEEQFIVLSNCNIDKELNLVSSFIISSDIIEDCFINGESSYDDQLFFIMCNVSAGNYSAQNGVLDGQTGSFPVYYNLALNGNSVMDNYFGGIPLSIAQYLGNPDNTSLATKTSNQSPVFGVYNVIQFQDDITAPNHDAGGNYNTANGRYTIPLSGAYSFVATIAEYYTPFQTQSYPVDYFIEQWDNAFAVLIARYPIGTINWYAGNAPIAIFGATFNAVSGQRIVTSFKEQFGFNNVVILPNSTYSCTNTIDGGGKYKDFDPSDYPVYKHAWEYPLTKDDFNFISRNQTLQLQFARSGEHHFNGWIDSVKFKRFKEEKAQFITYTSKKNLH